MANSKTRKPTRSELNILSVLWEKGGATVREVFETLNTQKKTSYTTILKLMQIMHEKKLVSRNEKNRAHVYQAAIKQSETGKQMLDEILNRVFGGSALRLVQQVLENKTTSEEDMKQIQKLIEQTEEEAKK